MNDCVTIFYTLLRDWEEWAPEGCQDIASQLVRRPEGQKLRVVLGGGRQSFLPTNVSDVTNGNSVEAGKRKDGLDLISEWMDNKKMSNSRAHYVTSKDELFSLDLNKTDCLLGNGFKASCLILILMTGTVSSAH